MKEQKKVSRGLCSRASLSMRREKSSKLRPLLEDTGDSDRILPVIKMKTCKSNDLFAQRVGNVVVYLQTKLIYLLREWEMK